MKTYELSCLISSELGIENAQTLSSEISSSLQKEGGLIIKSEGPTPKTLGYRIKGQGSALWINLEFSLEPDKLKDIKGVLIKNNSILRYLLVEKKRLKQKTRRSQGIKEAVEIKPIEEITEDKTEKKVELKDIDEKLEEILKDEPK